MTYTVTPAPDLEDEANLALYIQDRRVTGVCQLLLP